MSGLDAFPSAGVQEDIISASLNASMLLNFFMGMYTVVYVGTVYLYTSKKAANLNLFIVLSAISLLYLLYLANFLLQWYALYVQIVIKGDTRESLFISMLEGGPHWMLALDNFLLYSTLIVSDGLLIWRCYHIWGQSFRVTLVPLTLFMVEFALSATVTIFSVSLGVLTSATKANLLNSLSSALGFVSLGTTVITTFLIGYRINCASRTHGHPSSRRLFHRIVILVIESAAAYSFALLINAIITVIPSFIMLGSPILQVDYYMDVVLTSVSGLAPTILVARIALTDSNYVEPSTITHISGLQSESQQRNASDGYFIGEEDHIAMHICNATLIRAPEAESKNIHIDVALRGYQV